MKKVYAFLQSNAVAICILCGISPALTNMIAKTGSEGGVIAFSSTLAIASTMIFLLCLWYLKAKWELPKPAYMAALAFASVAGMLVGWSVLLAMLDVMTIEFQMTMVRFSYFAMIVMGIALFFQWSFGSE